MRHLCTFYAGFLPVLLDENYTHLLYVDFMHVLRKLIFFADFMRVIFLMHVLLEKNYIHT